MFFVLVALSAVTLALVTLRPVRALLSRRFSHIWLLWVAAALHFCFSTPALRSLVSMRPLPLLPESGGLLYVCSLALLVAFSWANRRHIGVAIIGIGLLLNTVVITANGGRMPVNPVRLAEQGSLQAMAAAEERGSWSSWAIAGQHTNVAFLGDQLLIPLPTGGTVILSVGDLAIAIGIVLFFMVIPEASKIRVPYEAISSRGRP